MDPYLDLAGVYRRIGSGTPTAPVDADVDLFDSNDVLRALTCLYQGDLDSIFIPGVLCHPIDPTSRPEYNPMIDRSGMPARLFSTARSRLT